MSWFVEWEYASTIAQAGVFRSFEEALRYVKRWTQMHEKSCYSQDLCAITIKDFP